MTEPENPELVGGRYAIVRELGRGGAAVVYLATDTQRGERVAIKVLHEELSESRLAERFRREIRLLANFGHENILPVLDSGIWGERLFYVMQYLENAESLRDRMQRDRAGLPIDELLPIALGVSRALSYAHERGVLHRDVKPENILVAGSHPYLTDFGVAKALTPLPDDTNTSSGYVLGTQRYMSPEQETADPAIDSRTDVWSLSCVMFEALTGLHPYHSPDVARMRSMKVSSAPESLRRHRPQAPRWLEQVIATGLQPNPADRWRSADELAEALVRGMKEGDATAEPATPSGARRAYDDAASSGGIASAGSARRSVSGASDSVGVGSERGSRRRLQQASIASLLVVLALVAVAWAKWGAAGRASSAPRADARVIALDFVAADDSTGLRDVVRRLEGEVVRELSRANALRVISPSAMEVCRAREAFGCDSMLSAQGVGTRVEGTIDRAGDSLALALEIGDQTSRSTLLALTLMAPNAVDVESLRRLATRVSLVLRQRLGERAEGEALLPANADDEARATVRAIRRERADAESLAALPGIVEQRNAVESLQRADSLLGVLLDRYPRHPRLWIERGWVALAMSERDASTRKSMLTRTLADADSAFARAPDEPRAFELRGHARIAVSADREADLQFGDRLECEAEGDLRRAVAGDDALYRSWGALSWLLWSMGRTAEARLAADHAMDHDAYLEGARASLVNIFFAQLELGNYAAARRVCLTGRDLWPADYKFLECQLTLMLFDTQSPPDASRARRLAQQADALDPREKARAMGNEYRVLYRTAVAGIVEARSGDLRSARATLARLRAEVEASGSQALRFDFRPEEAILLWEIGERSEARATLVDWLRTRSDEVANFRRDPRWRQMGVRDDVLRAAGLPLTADTQCPAR